MQSASSGVREHEISRNGRKASEPLAQRMK